MSNDPISSHDPVGSGTLELIAKADRLNRWMYDEFKSHLKGEILEAGSGIGNISQLVIADGLPVTLSDYNAEYCDWLKKNFGDNPNVREIIQIDLLHRDFESTYSRLKEKFDSIFLLNVIEHLSDDSLAIANCRYMMKPAAHLVVLAPAYPWLYCRLDKELGHFKRYSTRSITDLLSTANFAIRKINHFNALGIAGWLVSGKVLHNKKLGGGELNLFNRLVPVARWLDAITGRKIGLSIIGTAVKKTS